MRTNHTVCCLVRASGVDEGWKRIEQVMEEYKIWNASNQQYKNRIFPLLGDLGKPKLGLTDGKKPLAYKHSFFVRIF
jgi:thioester reductase-like protein